MAWLKELIGDIMTLKISTHYRTVYDTEEQELLDQVTGLKQKKKRIQIPFTQGRQNRKEGK